MDAYRKDSLDMRHNSTYAFNVMKSDTNSFGSRRFSLVFRQNPAYAYRLLSFTAAKAEGTIVNQREVQLNWTTENEQNYTNFTIERSTDGGKTYQVVGGAVASGQGNYSLFDKSPGDNNLYRLESEDINNNITYSNIVPIAYSNQSNNLVQNNISIYPNPAKTIINLMVTNAVNTSETYAMLITNNFGMVVKQATYQQANWQTNVADLLPGTYLIKILRNRDQTSVGTIKLIKL